MEIYIKRGGELIKFINGDDIIGALNTHAGDKQEVHFLLKKEEGKNIKNLMSSLSIVDVTSIYDMKRTDTKSNTVSYIRPSNNRAVFMGMKISDGEGKFVEVTPDEKGTFYLEKHWVEEDFEYKLVIEIEKGFSDQYGERLPLELEIKHFGEKQDAKAIFV